MNWMMDTLTNSVEELYALYHKDIVRFFAEHLVDREASWDLCHEVFVRLLITLASGTQLQYPQRWLMRVSLIASPQEQFRLPALQVVLPLAFGGCLMLLVTSGWTGVSGGLGWLFVGLIAYGV